MNGWETAPTSASGRCSSTRSGSLQEQHSQSAQTRVAKILKDRLGFTKAPAANGQGAREPLLARATPRKKLTVSSVTAVTRRDPVTLVTPSLANKNEGEEA